MLLRLRFTVERVHFLLLSSSEIIGKGNLGSLETELLTSIHTSYATDDSHSPVASAAINLALQSSDVEKGSSGSTLVLQSCYLLHLGLASALIDMK